MAKYVVMFELQTVMKIITDKKEAINAIIFRNRSTDANGIHTGIT